MAGKKKKKSGNGNRAATPQTPDPEIATADPEIEQVDPAFQTGDPGAFTPDDEPEETREDEDPEQDEPADSEEDSEPAENAAAEDGEEPQETARGKAIIDWRGRLHAHRCPYCNTGLLRDRETKACQVMSTRDAVSDEDGRHRDREMKCFWCQGNFIAREKIG